MGLFFHNQGRHPHTNYYSKWENEIVEKVTTLNFPPLKKYNCIVSKYQ